MYDAWRSFFVGILEGVISLLGVIFFAQTGVIWTLMFAAFGIFLAWNFVPIEHRRIAFIDKVTNAQNGVALLGWALPMVGFFVLVG